MGTEYICLPDTQTLVSDEQKSADLKRVYGWVMGQSIAGGLITFRSLTDGLRNRYQWSAGYAFWLYSQIQEVVGDVELFMPDSEDKLNVLYALIHDTSWSTYALVVEYYENFCSSDYWVWLEEVEGEIARKYGVSGDEYWEDDWLPPDARQELERRKDRWRESYNAVLRIGALLAQVALCSQSMAEGRRVGGLLEDLADDGFISYGALAALTAWRSGQDQALSVYAPREDFHITEDGRFMGHSE